MLPAQPQADDYQVLAADAEFRRSLGCLLFFTRLVPDCVYTALETINFHPSLLPEHPGLSGFDSAIRAGQLGVSAHRVNSTMDGGKILRQYSIAPFPRGRSAEELEQESSLLCSAAILSILRDMPMVRSLKRQDFLSGANCIEAILLMKAIA